MSDVVLVNPYWYMTRGNQDDLWLPFPNGLAGIAAALVESGYTVEIIDVLAEGYDTREWCERDGRHLCRIGLREQALCERLSRTGARYVGIGNMFTGVFRASQECATIASLSLPQATVVMGGVHPSCDPERTALQPQVHYVVSGEGEYAFIDLLQHLEGFRPMPPGVFWRESGDIKSSGPASPISDLDSLPMLAYGLINMDLYRNASRTDLIHRGGRGS